MGYRAFCDFCDNQIDLSLESNRLTFRDQEMTVVVIVTHANSQHSVLACPECLSVVFDKWLRERGAN